MTVDGDRNARFHASLQRACADDRFLDLFYTRFIDADERIPGFFSNTDMQRQKRKLMSSLQMMTRLVDDEPGADMYMDHLARVHDRYHIPAQMYDLWLDALIDAVRQCDTEFDDDLEMVWRDMVGRGIDIMTSTAGSTNPVA
jgi:truncated hemoglobin YjbI